MKRKAYDELIGKSQGFDHAEFFKTGKDPRGDDFGFSFFANRKVREEFAEEIYVDFSTYFGSEDTNSKVVI